MKRIFVLLGVLVLFSSCIKPISLKDIPEGEHINYINTATYTGTFSPSEYNSVKGTNPAAAYSWHQVTVKTWHPKWFVYYKYQGNQGALVDAAFPEADSILAYNGYFFVGKKNKSE